MVCAQGVLIHAVFRARAVLCDHGLDHHQGGLLDADRGVDLHHLLGLSPVLDGAVMGFADFVIVCWVIAGILYLLN